MSEYFEIRQTERRQSESIVNLTKALVQVQKELKNPKKASDNPYHRSKYADLATCADECRPLLSNAGIAVVAFPSSNGALVSVETVLIHESGEWMSCTLSAESRAGKRDEGVKPDTGAQSIVAVVTYLRRCTLSAMVFLTPEDEDDDGNRASGHTNDRGREDDDTPRYTKVANAFRKFDVSISMIEKSIGKKITDASDEDFDYLGEIYRAISKDGKKAESFFKPDEPVDQSQVTTTTAQLPATPEVATAPPVNHEPAPAGDEPRPGEQKRGRGRPPGTTKKKEEKTEESPQTEPTTVSEPAATETPAEPPMTDDQKKEILPKVRSFTQEFGPDKVGDFVKTTLGVDSTSGLSKNQWDRALVELEKAKTEGRLKK